MGDPKKQRKKYSTPSHPWQAARIDEEKKLTEEYGFKNKKEIWKITSTLNKYKGQAKKLIPLSSSQAEKEKEQLLKKLFSLGLIQEISKIEDVLSLTLKDLLERRLQTQVYRQNLARSTKQARQFISHNHIMVGENIITSPSYLIKKTEETSIKFVSSSTLSDPEHAERNLPEKKIKKVKNVKRTYQKFKRKY